MARNKSEKGPFVELARLWHKVHHSSDTRASDDVVESYMQELRDTPIGPRNAWVHLSRRERHALVIKENDG